MTNSIAILLGLVIICGITADQLLADGANLIFLTRKLFALTEWMAFWR